MCVCVYLCVCVCVCVCVCIKYFDIFMKKECPISAMHKYCIDTDSRTPGDYLVSWGV